MPIPVSPWLACYCRHTRWALIPLEDLDTFTLLDRGQNTGRDELKLPGTLRKVPVGDFLEEPLSQPRRRPGSRTLPPGCP